MSLAVFNGSPRGKKSNSRHIINWFLDGCGPDRPETFYLNRVDNQEELLPHLENNSEFLFVFPLYVDAAPGQVKAFFELMEEHREILKGKKVAFVIHSGFGEAIQNRALESYLNTFSQKMNMVNNGVIIIPGSEGFRMMPPSMTAKKREALKGLAVDFLNGNPYDPDKMKLLRGREQYSQFMMIVLRFLSMIGLTNLYWNSVLKKNNAFNDRFDAPYLERPVEISTEAYLTNKK